MKNSPPLVRYTTVGPLLALALAISARAQDTGLVLMYQLTELKVENATQSRAYALNDTGQVIGWVVIDQRLHSAHWHNEVGTDLHGVVHFELKHPLFDQDYSEAYDISNADQVVGTARTLIDCGEEQFVVTHGYVLRPAVLTDLATPYPGDALINLMTFGNPCLTAYDSAATGISNRSHVVGWADRIDGVIHAFLVVPQNGRLYLDANVDLVNDLMIDLGTLGSSDPVSSATAVNDSGQVTGYSYTLTPDGKAAYRAFLVTPADTNADGVGDVWYSGTNGKNDLMADLTTLGGTNSWGRDVNNAGQVVGESDAKGPDGESYTHAFLWTAGAMADLGTLRTNTRHGFSAASGLNEKGEVVGWAENEKRQRRAFVYRDGQMYDLNSLLYLRADDGTITVPGITLTEARDINEDGVIVGWGEIRGTQGTETRGFLLNPVWVDPSTLVDEDDGTADDDDTGTTPTDSPGSTIDLNGDPIFGTPEHLLAGLSTNGLADANDPNAPTETPVPTLCGTGTLAMLPLALLMLGGLKLARPRRPA